MKENSKPTNKKTFIRLPNLLNLIVGVFFVSIIGGIFSLMGLTLFMQESFCQSSPINGFDFFKQTICWFDPVLMVYNLALLLLLIMVVPIITFCYVHTMRERKRGRLPQEVLNNPLYTQKINACLDLNFKMSSYAGSITMLSIVILLGGMIILLLKPMAISGSGVGNNFGIDYSKGANFLMLGSYMHHFIEGNKQEYMRVIVGTLTAFQFGFLGAYVYFITHLVRSYFTLDLSPNIYISCAVRIMMGSMLSLVLSFAFINENIDNNENRVEQIEKTVSTQNTAKTKQDINNDLLSNEKELNENAEITVFTSNYYLLPLLGFFIGFFPLRGLLLIERTAGKILHIGTSNYHSTNLTKLAGMSYQHEIRLNREGFDNIENFVSADIIDLSMRTGFSYKQLLIWKSQAILFTHLGGDYERFKHATSIDSADELLTNKDWFLNTSNSGALKTIIDESLYQKIRILLNTLQQEKHKDD